MTPLEKIYLFESEYGFAWYIGDKKLGYSLSGFELKRSKRAIYIPFILDGFTIVFKKRKGVYI